MYPLIILLINWFYNLVIGLCGLLIGTLAFAPEISNVKGFKWINSLWLKVPLFIGVSFIAIWATIQKDNDAEVATESNKRNTETILNIRDSLNKDELHKRDSLHQSKELEQLIANRQVLIESNNKNLKTYTEVLGKYNLELDDANKKIISLVRDSSKESSDIPHLQLCMDIPAVRKTVHQGEEHLDLKLCNVTGFAARNINYEIYILDVFGNNVALNSKLPQIEDMEALAPNAFRTVTIRINPQGKRSDTIAICLVGTYQNSYGRKLILNTQTFWSINKEAVIGELPYQVEQSLVALFKNNVLH
jgi:hypothetical protein